MVIRSNTATCIKWTCSYFGKDFMGKATLVRFSTKFDKGDNFYEFLFVSLQTKPFGIFFPFSKRSKNNSDRVVSLFESGLHFVTKLYITFDKGGTNFCDYLQTKSLLKMPNGLL